jgi:hypothetical protein
VVLYLTTNEHQPLLGTVRAILGLPQLGLQTEDFMLVCASHEIDTFLCVGLHTANASVSLHLDAFDALIGFSFDLEVGKLHTLLEKTVGVFAVRVVTILPISEGSEPYQRLDDPILVYTPIAIK